MSQSEPNQISPREAIELFKNHRESDVNESTLQAYEYRLKHFARWTDQEDIEAMSDLNPMRMQEYRLWRRADGDLANITLRSQLASLKVFVRFCEAIEVVPEDLTESITLPDLNNGEGSRETILEEEYAEEILEHLRKYEWASLNHTILELAWHTGIRLGAMHSLDVDDFDPRECSIELVHRPDQGSTLKNGRNGERIVALSPSVTQVIDDYIEEHRTEATDDYGREPLFSSPYGRLNKSRIRERIYAISRPCQYGECPSGKNPEDCPGAVDSDAYKCDHKIPPHDVRRGAITRMLRDDIPIDVVSGRVNASRKILEKHYDRMTPTEKMEQRRQFFIG